MRLTTLGAVLLALLALPAAGIAKPNKAPKPQKAKIGICHKTGSSTNPYVFIQVSSRAQGAHEGHGDIIGVSSAADCPGANQPPPKAVCEDGVDNDHDGKIDFPADPGCASASDSDETDAVACNATTQAGGQGVTTTVHELGSNSGTFEFFYDAYSIPDAFEIKYEGNVIYTTNGPVSGTNTVQVPYSGASSQVSVTVTGPDSGTAWEYEVRCPGSGV